MAGGVDATVVTRADPPEGTRQLQCAGWNTSKSGDAFTSRCQEKGYFFGDSILSWICNKHRTQCPDDAIPLGAKAGFGFTREIDSSMLRRKAGPSALRRGRT